MEKKNLVSFEAAKLLKAKGYDEPCVYAYWDRATSLHMGVVPVPNSVLPKDKYAAPTRQDAEAWLREKHNVYLAIRPIKITKDYIFFDAWIWDFFDGGFGTTSFSGYETKYENIEDNVIKTALLRL